MPTVIRIPIHLSDHDQIMCRHTVTASRPGGYPVVEIDGPEPDAPLVAIAFTRGRLERLRDCIGAYLAAHPAGPMATCPGCGSGMASMVGGGRRCFFCGHSEGEASARPAVAEAVTACDQTSVCTDCEGDGLLRDDGYAVDTCPRCKGSGVVPDDAEAVLDHDDLLLSAMAAGFEPRGVE